MRNDLEVWESIEAERKGRESERNDRPSTINVRGRRYTLTPDGSDIADERQRAAVWNLAVTQADHTVRRGITRHNKDVARGDRQEIRPATDKEVRAAYKQLLDDGRHRAETGHSSIGGVDLGDILGGDPDAA